MAPDADTAADRAADLILTDRQAGAIAAALREIADEQRRMGAAIATTLDAARREHDARALAYAGVAGLLGSYPGKALGVLLGLVLLVALAKALGVDVEAVRAFAGVVPGVGTGS